jgi:predicted nucleic acid-binding Zn ribbon protein
VGEDHRHCKVCGRTCTPDEETCSTACREERERRARSRRMYMYLLYGTAALLLVLLLSHAYV